LLYFKNEWGWELKLSKKKEGRCCVLFCRNKLYKGHYCTTHSKRRDFLKSPERAYYDRMKVSAWRRNISVTITFAEFKEWTQAVNLVEIKKREKNWSIDRKDVLIGYAKGNLQLLTVSDNASKWWYEKYHKIPDRYERACREPVTPIWMEPEKIDLSDIDDCPF
jgi:hypothetical protein